MFEMLYCAILLASYADSTAKAVLKKVYRFHDKKRPVHKYYNAFRISVSVPNITHSAMHFHTKKCIHILINIFYFLCETEEKGAEEKKSKEKEDEVKNGQNEAEKAPSAEVQVLVFLVVHARMR
jgi:hypothetical protein